MRARRSPRFTGGFKFARFNTPFSKTRNVNRDDDVDVVFWVLDSPVVAVEPELVLDRAMLSSKCRFARVNRGGTVGF